MAENRAQKRSGSSPKGSEANVAAEGSGAGGDDGLFAARRSKASAFRDRGENPFANDLALVDRSTLAAVRRRFDEALEGDATFRRYDPDAVERMAQAERFHVVGRVVSRRGFGKASFLRLRDFTDELQLFAKKDVMGEAFEVMKDLDVGDHVEARGVAMVTKTGELSIQLDTMRVVTKAYRPLPDKWHGLTDVDLRYRQRYVDFVANPDAADVMRARTVIVQGLRDFLDGRDFIEVETPTLHTLIGGAAAKPFETHHNALDLGLFLRIAPELYLKRLLVGGFERVYEIGRCYRNEGISTRHNPEFTMLEFYLAYADYRDLMSMTEEMLRHVDEFLRGRFEAAGKAALHARWCADRPFTFAEPFARVPLAEAIARAVEKAGLQPGLEAGLEDLAMAPPAEGVHPKASEALAARLDSLAKHSDRAGQVDWYNLARALAACETDGDRRFVAYEYLAEPFLPEDYRAGDRSLPVFITDYPFEVSPLARKKDSDPSLTDRFELFVHGREVCNAFSELNDPDDQAERFRDQVSRKARGDEETMDYDEDYVRALEYGMPPAAGFGLGVDRLVMALTNQQSIRDVIAFPLLRPEQRH